MAILKSLAGRGDQRRHAIVTQRITQAGNCCGAQVISNFPTHSADWATPYSEQQLRATLSQTIERLMTDLKTCALDPDDESLQTETYDEDEDDYVTAYPDDVRTVDMQPSIITAYLANRQIPQWHQTLLNHGFTLLVEGATNSKSLGGLINMYVGEMPTSRKYGKAMGRPNARMPRGLKATKNHGGDRFLGKEPA